MAGLTLSTASGILKEVYLPGVREQLNNAAMLLAQLERNGEDVVGLEAIVSVHTRRSSGVTNIPEGGVLPTPGNQGYAKARVGQKTITARGQVTLQAQQSMVGAGAFEKAVTSEMKRLVTDAKRDLNRQLLGSGDGIIAVTGVTTASATVVLNANTPKSALRQLEIGQKVDVGTAANVQGRVAGATIVSVDTTNKTVTLDSAITTATTDRIFRARPTANGTSAVVELTGLQKIVATSGVLFGIDPAVEPVWAVAGNAYDVPGGNRSISENLLEKIMDEIAMVSGEEANLAITTPGVMRSYSSVLTTMKRANDTINLKGGFKGLSISAGGREVALTKERDQPDNLVTFVNTDHLKLHEWTDWDYMDDDGAVLNRVPNTAAWEWTLYKMAELGTDKRNAHGALGAITES